jgi:hypothetical protein
VNLAKDTASKISFLLVTNAPNAFEKRQATNGRFSNMGNVGVCSTDLGLDTSTNGLKQVYTSLEAFYQKTYFLKNVHLKISKNF